MTTVCHGCQDVTRRQVEALEAQLAEARAEVERLRIERDVANDDSIDAASAAGAEEVARLHEHIAYHLRDFRPGADDKASGDLAVDMGAYADRMKAERDEARAALAWFAARAAAEGPDVEAAERVARALWEHDRPNNPWLTDGQYVAYYGAIRRGPRPAYIRRADAVVAALRPAAREVVETAEGLDALPIGSVVVDRMGDAAIRDGRVWHQAETVEMASARLVRYGPFRVLYRPAAADGGA